MYSQSRRNDSFHSLYVNPSIMLNEQLKKVHRFSGILMAGFILLHLFNHLFALGGPIIHQEVMRTLRKVYRFPPIEIALLLAVSLQIISGPVLIWKNRRQKDRYKWLQIVSGLYLAFFLCYHISAVMLGRYKWNVETDYHFAASVVKYGAQKIFFIPYYMLSVIAVFVHVACVHREKLMEKQTGSNVIVRANTQARIIMLTGIFMAVWIILGLIGVRL